MLYTTTNEGKYVPPLPVCVPAGQLVETHFFLSVGEDRVKIYVRSVCVLCAFSLSPAKPLKYKM